MAQLVCSEYTNQGLFSDEMVYVEVATADKTQEFIANNEIPHSSSNHGATNLWGGYQETQDRS